MLIERDGILQTYMIQAGIAKDYKYLIDQNYQQKVKNFRLILLLWAFADQNP